MQEHQPQTITSSEIATTMLLTKVEAKIVHILRDNGVLIDPNDMRSPLTIAENMGLVIVKDEV